MSAVGAAAVVLQQGATVGPDPFAFLAPSVTIDAGTRRSIDAGHPYAKVLSAGDDELAILAVVSARIDGDRLVSWMRAIEQLKKSRYVLAIHRFSDPPVIEDLDGLRLDADDVGELRSCQPDQCGLKLGADELRELQAAAAAGAADPERVQRAFRRVMLKRVRTYQHGGLAALPSAAGRNPPVAPSSVFSMLVADSPYVRSLDPSLANDLARYPFAPRDRIETLLYWSKERVGNKPIVSITHLSILRGRGCGQPEAVVAATQIFATHYFDGSLGLTALVRNCAGPANYLVYLNRSELDVLGGFWGGLVRLIVQRRVRGEAAAILDGLRARLESGEPDDSAPRGGTPGTGPRSTAAR